MRSALRLRNSMPGSRSEFGQKRMLPRAQIGYMFGATIGARLGNRLRWTRDEAEWSRRMPIARGPRDVSLYSRPHHQPT